MVELMYKIPFSPVDMVKATRVLWVEYSRVPECRMLSSNCSMNRSSFFSLSQWTLKKKFERLIFPTKYVIPKRSKKFKVWPLAE